MASLAHIEEVIVALEAAPYLDDLNLGLTAEDLAAARTELDTLKANGAPVPVADTAPIAIDDGGEMACTDHWERSDHATWLALSDVLHEAAPDEATVATWTDDQVKEADVWAYAMRLRAGDQDDSIKVPPRPAQLGGAG